MNTHSNLVINQKIDDLKIELNELSEQIEKEREESSEENPSLQELLDKKELLLTELEELENPDESLTGSNSEQLDHIYVVEINGVEKRLKIVIPAEADPSQSLISSQSPLAQALVGKKAGDKVTVTAPVGKLDYKIKAVKK
jgi:transcription elongation factor GreA